MGKFNIYLLMTSLFITTFFVSCEKKSSEDKIVGKWEYQMMLSKEDVRKLSEDPIPEGIEIEITGKGTSIYHKNKKYEGEGDMTMKIITSSEEISMDFYAKETGDWNLQSDGKELVETTIDGIFSPQNEMAKKFIKETPEFADFVKPLKGSTAVSKIMSISDRIIELKGKEMGIKIILSRIENEEK